MFPARFELATFRVLGGRDNHYTTETTVKVSAFFEENSVTYSNGKVITTFRDNFSLLCTLEDPGAVSRVG